MTGQSAFSGILTRIFPKYILICALLLAPPACNAAQICDDLGTCLDASRPASRVIALYGAFNEMLLALGAADAIVARTATDGDIPALAALPSVGTHMRPNAELIMALKPDVVLQMAGRGEAQLQTENLARVGVKTLTFDIKTLPQLFDVMLKLGQLTGKEREAEALTHAWQKRLRAIPKPKAGKKPTVYYEAREPQLLAAGRYSIVNDIIEHAGCQNAVNIPKKLVRYNEEALLLANPDICIIQKGPMNPNPRPMQARPHLKNLGCVQKGNFFVVDEKTFARPGPGTIRAVEELARAAWEQKP